MLAFLCLLTALNHPFYNDIFPPTRFAQTDRQTDGHADIRKDRDRPYTADVGVSNIEQVVEEGEG